jgi:peroxiredoxin Q/BCP
VQKKRGALAGGDPSQGAKSFREEVPLREEWACFPTKTIYRKKVVMAKQKKTAAKKHKPAKTAKAVKVAKAAKKVSGKTAKKAKAVKVVKAPKGKKTAGKKAAGKTMTKKAVPTKAKTAKVAKEKTTPKVIQTKATKPRKEITDMTLATPSTPAGNDPLIGKPLTGLNLPMTGGQNFDLTRYAGKKVVLYFYPKDMTPGCTQEGHDFTNLVSEFDKVNTVVLGISKDSVDKHEKFITKENYKIHLVSDNDGAACQMFDVIKEKNMYGKKVMGIERSTFLIGADGKVEQVWRKVKVDGHAQAVLDYIKAHQ